MPQEIKSLYITFDGMTDPLGRAQVLPYLEDLSKNNIRFYLISLEKDLGKAKELSKTIEDAGIAWYRLKYFKHNPLLMAFNVLRCFLVSFYVVASQKIEIIHCRSYLPLFSVFLLKKIFKVKIIFDTRGFWIEGLVDIGRIKKDSIYYKVLKFLEKRSILMSDYLITLTPESEEIFKSIYSGAKFKTAWMPTCVDTAKFQNSRPVGANGEFVVVYSGSLLNYYNVPAMADFFNALKEKIKKAHFLILANNGVENAREFFRQKGIDEGDYTILNVDPENVPGYLLGSDIAVSFIYDFYFGKASFPTKLAEYLACGLPVVANTQSKFIKDLVENNKIGTIVEKFDSAHLHEAAEKLSLLLQDSDLKSRCREMAKKYLAKNVCSNKYLEIYRELE